MLKEDGRKNVDKNLYNNPEGKVILTGQGRNLERRDRTVPAVTPEANDAGALQRCGLYAKFHVPG